jgi:hypothetical protein
MTPYPQLLLGLVIPEPAAGNLRFGSNPRGRINTTDSGTSSGERTRNLTPHDAAPKAASGQLPVRGDTGGQG